MLGMKTGLLFTTLFVLLSVAATAQGSPTCDSVVKKVAFENTTGLTTKQVSSISKLLVGRCFKREHPQVLSEAIYRQLREWGYKQPTVIDPDKGRDIRVLNATAIPSPVAVTIDFRVSGFDDFRK
jgi:hypothetical protein